MDAKGAKVSAGSSVPKPKGIVLRALDNDAWTATLVPPHVYTIRDVRRAQVMIELAWRDYCAEQAIKREKGAL